MLPKGAVPRPYRNLNAILQPLEGIMDCGRSARERERARERESERARYMGVRNKGHAWVKKRGRKGSYVHGWYIHEITHGQHTRQSSELTDAVSIQADNLGACRVSYKHNLVVVRIVRIGRSLLSRFEFHVPADMCIKIGAAF